MNRFLKINSPWLGLLGLALAIVILAFIFRPKPPEYQISTNQTLKLINGASLEVDVQDIDGKQLIDIRSAELFAQGHPGNAINIPVRNLLNDESAQLLDQLLENGTEAIIYGSDELQATAPWLLLQQLGYHNLKILKGGFTSTDGFKVSDLASTESSVLDTSAFKVKPGILNASQIKSEKKQPKTIIPVRKEVSSGGGC